VNDEEEKKDNDCHPTPIITQGLEINIECDNESKTLIPIPCTPTPRLGRRKLLDDSSHENSMKNSDIEETLSTFSFSTVTTDSSLSSTPRSPMSTLSYSTPSPISTLTHSYFTSSPFSSPLSCSLSLPSPASSPLSLSSISFETSLLSLRNSLLPSDDDDLAPEVSFLRPIALPKRKKFPFEKIDGNKEIIESSSSDLVFNNDTNSDHPSLRKGRMTIERQRPLDPPY